MSLTNKLMEKLAVDTVNKVGEMICSNKGAIKDVSSTLVGITLDRDEWLEIAADVGKKSAAGAAIDGSFGLYKAAIYYKNGHINKKTFAKHVVSEIGCGFLSSAAGNAGSITVKLFTPNKGIAFIVGIGVSAGTRWLYRKYMPDSLPDLNPKEGEKEQEDIDSDILQEIARTIRDRYK